MTESRKRLNMLIIQVLYMELELAEEWGDSTYAKSLRRRLDELESIDAEEDNYGIQTISQGWRV